MCSRMWSGEHGDDGSFDGHSRARERLLNLPQALQRPRPPILIAGDGERRTLPLVARVRRRVQPAPDAGDPAQARRPAAPLRQRRHRLRPRRAHLLYAFDVDDGGPATRELIGQLQWLAGLGIDTVIGRVEGLEQRTPVELLAPPRRPRRRRAADAIGAVTFHGRSPRAGAGGPAGIQLSFIAGMPGAPPLPGKESKKDAWPSRSITRSSPPPTSVRRPISSAAFSVCSNPLPGARSSSSLSATASRSTSWTHTASREHHYAFLVDEAEFDPIF